MGSVFEILPHVLRDGDQKRTVAEEYESLRQLDVELLASGDDKASAKDLEGLAALLMATCDGLIIQSLLDPDGFDLERPFAVLRNLLVGYLDVA